MPKVVHAHAGLFCAHHAHIKSFSSLQNETYTKMGLYNDYVLSPPMHLFYVRSQPFPNSSHAVREGETRGNPDPQ